MAILTLLSSLNEGLAANAMRIYRIMVNARTIFAVALAVFSLTTAGGAIAQVPPPQPPQQACGPQVTPSSQVLYDRLMRRFGPLGLSPAQQQQIQSMVNAYSQAHPAGSPFDPAANRQLRESARGVLTQQQLAQLEQETQANREEHPHRCP